MAQELRNILIGAFLLAFVISIVGIDEAYGNNAPRPVTVFKIHNDYPADVAFFDQALPYAVQDINKTMIFMSFSHTGDGDSADSSRSWELIDNSTLRIFGENTASGNNPSIFVAYIIEIQDDKVAFNTEHRERLVLASETVGEYLIKLDNPVNTSRAFAMFQGTNFEGSDATWGSEEFGEVSVFNSTHARFTNIDSDSVDVNNKFTIVSFNNSTTDSFVQRGSGTMSGMTATISPPIDVNRNNTMVLLTWTIDLEVDSPADDSLVRVSLDATVPPDIQISREELGGNIEYSWELISFDPTIAKVHHDSVTFGDGVLSVTDTLATPVLDMDKAFVFSGASSPFGFGTGEAHSGSGGAFDRGMARIFVSDQDEVTLTRQDSTRVLILDYQVVEMLEEKVPEETTGINNRFLVRQLQGVFTAGDTTEDFQIVPPLTNLNKTMSFVTFRVDFDTSDGQGASKSWEIVNENTLRIQGNHEPSIVNPAMPFTAVIVEYDINSPILVQRDLFTYLGDMSVGEKIMEMSPVNMSNTMILKSGRHLTGGDNTYGMEEYDRVRLISNTTWGYDVEAFQDTGSVSGTTSANVEIVDWNDDRVLVQRGMVTLTGGTTSVTVSPPTDVIQNRTMMFFTYQTATGDFDDNLNNVGLMGTVDSSSPPDLVFSRVGTTGGLEINWQTVSIPDRMGIVQHITHTLASGTGNNTATIPITLFNASEAFAVSTTNQHSGFGFGKSDSVTDSKIDHAHVQVTLENKTHVRFERDDTTGSLVTGIQVVSLEDSFCDRCVNQTGSVLEPNATNSFTQQELEVIHQFLEWFEPTSDGMTDVINTIEPVTSSNLYQLLLDIQANTVATGDANMKNASVFYQDRYLVQGNLTKFIEELEDDVRGFFGAELRP